MANKKATAEKISSGLERLRQAGVAVDSPSAALVTRLQSELHKDLDTDLAICFLLGKIPDLSAVQALSTIEQSTVNKEVRKEARRALFKLSQRGLAAQAEEPQRSREAIFGREPSIEAYMSPPDGSGGSLLWIVKPQPNRGLQVIQAMVHRRDGLLRIGGMQMPRKELRRMMREIQSQHGATMIPVPWEYADLTLYQAYETAKARGQSGLERFHEVRSVIATGKPKEVRHPIYEKLDVGEAREGPWREASRRLLEEPELRYWIVTDEWLQPLLAQLQEARTSRLVLNPAQKEERLAAIVREGVKELCRGASGKAFQHRMEDLALYFLETEREAQAKLALAVAAQVGEGDPGPLDVSFLTGLVQKSFAVLLSQQKARQEEEPSLIIKP